MAAVALPERAAVRHTLPTVPALLLAGGIGVALASGALAENWPQRIALAALLSVLAGISALDSHTLRAPNRIVYPAAFVAVSVPFLFDLNAGIQALSGAGVAFAAVLVVVIAGRGAMGYGDAKVAWVCGAIVGWSNVVLFFVATFAIGGMFAALALTIGRRGRKDSVAFTPFLFLGVVASLVFGTDGAYELQRPWQ